MSSAVQSTVVTANVITGGKGDPGEGVPTGGTTNQILRKNSSADYDTSWVTQGTVSLISRTTDYTLTPDDYIVDESGSNVTITLPTVSGITGKEYVIKNSGTGTITVQGSEPIDGETTQRLSQGDCLTIAATTTGWIIT